MDDLEHFLDLTFYSDHGKLSHGLYIDAVRP